MRFKFKHLVFSIAIFTSATVFAEQARLVVPFSFLIKTQVFPSGSYHVAMDSNQNLITLASDTNSTKNITVVVESAEKATAGALLLFDVVGTNHYLRSIQMKSRVSEKLDVPGKRHNP